LKENHAEESFKVVDRRLFTESGELRREAIEEERREQEEAKKAPNPSAEQAASGNKTAPAKKAGADEAKSAPAPSRGFQMLVNFLAQNAAAMLGGMADPRTGKAFVDLEGAREMIDMLDALREKSMGNLAQDDEQLLLDVIGSLKLTFMEVSKAAAEAMREKAKAKP
jgi:hypothetical protein